MQKTPLNWLRSFTESARLLSFTRAAQELLLTQAAVSKHIKSLEATLGVQLFIREAHGLQLTEQGKRFYAECAPLLDDLEGVTQQFTTRADPNRLRIRSNISYSTLLLPRRLAALSVQWPDITVDINNGIWQPERPSANAHLEIGYALRASLQTGETLKLLEEDDQQFPVTATHLTQEQLNALPLIQVAGYGDDWQWWLLQQREATQADTVCQWSVQRQEQQHKILRTDNSMTAYQLCAEGLGIALARSAMVQTYLDSGLLQKLPNSHCVPARYLFFARLTELGQQQDAAKALFALI